MSRSLLLSLAAALCVAAAGPAQQKSAFDKAALEAYVRHLYLIGPQFTVQIADPKPSELPGFQEVRVKISQGNNSQELPLYVSKDGIKVVQGNVYDINFNPFKTDLDKLKTEGSPSYGTPGATVVLVEFSDFQCPHCKDEANVLRQNLVTGYPKQVRLYFKDFPLESIHPAAKPLAMAGRCVFRQAPTAFWDYHDYVFAHQAEFTAENVKDKVMEWAKGAKDVDAMQVGQCIDRKATASEVEKTEAEGMALGINSTPTLFINGRRIATTIDWPNLKAIIDNEIEYQKTAKNAGEDCGCELKLDLPGLPSKTPAAVLPAKKK